MAQEEMVIFTRTFDLLDWLLPRTNHFPRAHRHTFTRRLLDAVSLRPDRSQSLRPVRSGEGLNNG
jgi:hypothetical protein